MVPRVPLVSVILLIVTAFGARGQSGYRDWKLPVQIKQLGNGLRVVVSEDHSAPTVGICISYGVGFRLEPERHTGFAHLFEHMMFEGTPIATKGVFDRVTEGGGGSNNGGTNYDYTEYIEAAPISALDQLLWLEADRMKILDFSVANLENQRKVVEEEVRLRVLNQPYGLFYAIDLPSKAFDTYPNAHNFYGDFRDLDAAKVGDVQSFFETYYTPRNAVLAIVGDVKSDEVFAKVDRHFGKVRARPAPPVVKVDEPPQTAERRAIETDKLARVPAIAIGYRMPAHGTHDAVVAAVTGELLHNGEASLLYQYLIKQKHIAISVDGGVNWPHGTPLEFKGPTLMTSFIVAPPNTREDDLIAAYDAVVNQLANKGPSAQELARITVKMRSDWYGQLELPISRASALSHAVLFDGNADSVTGLPKEIAEVTPSEVRAFSIRYLVPANRTIIYRVPAAGERK